MGRRTPEALIKGLRIHPFDKALKAEWNAYLWPSPFPPDLRSRSSTKEVSPGVEGKIEPKK